MSGSPVWPAARSISFSPNLLVRCAGIARRSLEVFAQGFGALRDLFEADWRGSTSTVTR